MYADLLESPHNAAEYRHVNLENIEFMNIVQLCVINNLQMQIDFFMETEILKNMEDDFKTPHKRRAFIVSDQGFYGVNKTAYRIISCILQKCKTDKELHKAAKQAVTGGFKKLEQMNIEKLPDISCKTYQRTLQLLK